MVFWEQKSEGQPTYYFEGVISKAMNFITGKCGSDRNNLSTGFNLFMNETSDVKLEFRC